MNAIEAANVSKVYGTAANPVPVLNGVTFSVGAGERVALLGKSGSGKSTLLHLLAGLDAPTSGTVRVEGLDLTGMSRGRLARFRSTTVGMVFQAFHLIPTRTAWQNVELPLIFAGVAPRERRERARQALEAVGLGHRLTHRPAELSGGEKQRVAIARALVNGPSVLLADEPTGNLDSRTADEIVRLLLGHLDRTGATLVLVTHDADVAARCAGRVLQITDGRVG